MESLFFIASKTIGMLARFETWILILLGAALLLGAAGRVKAMHRVVGLAFAAVLALTVFPLGTPLLRALEVQYPAMPPLPAHVDGIIVLGGAEDHGPAQVWGLPNVNEAGERMTAGVELARLFPHAKLIFTGGSAHPLYDVKTDASAVMTRQLWMNMGVPEAQIVLEDRSRNTSENAVFSKALLQPQPGQNWIFVTSAFHMPRAVETFERNGWTGLIPYPVDFRTAGAGLGMGWKLDAHLDDLNVALKEHLGLVVYRLAGK
ncbi:YdcF family protein [Xinfangfangia sp. CPCC 101601]|uniref:YdcF family protein n=1 Tax=Pseudogemmobacter lacusdianii TaxID=3069608 RepID=A0ABU0VXK3_9RHOB|nr:YdcF family protein [Xinfangfangia sp. CPCC 101601]MDQ2066238.1 YdcF family protein [Xinfangfangia sp. CPCC 101601]